MTGRWTRTIPHGAVAVSRAGSLHATRSRRRSSNSGNSSRAPCALNQPRPAQSRSKPRSGGAETGLAPKSSPGKVLAASTRSGESVSKASSTPFWFSSTNTMSWPAAVAAPSQRFGVGRRTVWGGCNGGTLKDAVPVGPNRTGVSVCVTPSASLMRGDQRTPTRNWCGVGEAPSNSTRPTSCCVSSMSKNTRPSTGDAVSSLNRAPSCGGGGSATTGPHATARNSTHTTIVFMPMPLSPATSATFSQRRCHRATGARHRAPSRNSSAPGSRDAHADSVCVAPACSTCFSVEPST